MRVTISIPTRLLRPLADALAARYGYTARSLHDLWAGAPRACLAEDPDLAETLGMLGHIQAELAEGAGDDHVVEVAVTGERELLSAAVHELLQSGVAALTEACERYPTGTEDVPELEHANRHVGEVLRLFRETELVSAQHPDQPNPRGGPPCPSR